MTWMELSLDTTAEAIDWVCTLLAETHYQDEIRITKCLGSSWTFTVYLYLPENAHRQVDAIAQTLLPLHRTGIASELQIRTVENKTVTTPPIHSVGQKFVIVADNHDPVPEDKKDKLVLKISPRLAFGSGLHPATMLSLQLIEQYVTPGIQALDLGSGSGILSVAIARLGGQVLAVDNDAIAVRSTQETVLRNAVNVQVMQGSLASGSDMGHWMGGEVTGEVAQIDAFAPFDLIAANILARVHIALAADYRRVLRSGGLLIAAGFNIDYEADVVAALTTAGLEKCDERRSDDWVALAYRAS
jgi:ribosomal protein L11 methyltransferase